MAQEVFKQVTVNHTGFCEGFFYVANEIISLPEHVLQAIGTETYTEVKTVVKAVINEEAKAVTEKVIAETKIEAPVTEKVVAETIETKKQS